MKANPQTEVLLARLRELAAQGLTAKEAAVAVGRSYTGLHNLITRYGLEFAGARRGRKRLGYVAELRRLAEEGLTTAEAARALKTNVNRVYRLATQHSISFANPFEKRAKQTLSDLAEQGATRRGAALAAGISYGSVYARSRKWRIQFEDARVEARRTPDIVAREADIIRRRDAGESYGQIASIYGITRQRVQQIASKATISSRLPILPGGLEAGGGGVPPLPSPPQPSAIPSTTEPVSG